MKFGICNEIFRDWKIEKGFEFAKNAGYDAIEIAPFTLAKDVNDISPKARSEIRNLAAKMELEISGIHWILVETEGMHLTHPDAEVRKRTGRYLCDLVDFCGDLGGKAIIVGSPKQRNLLPGVSFKDAWDWAKEVFTPSILKAEKQEIVICLEPLSPSETNFINTAEEAIAFTNAFHSEHFKIILDVKAMCSMGKPIDKIIRSSANELGYFHANDENLKGPGFGKVDFLPIAAALKDVKYDGYVSVEVFDFEEGPEVIATQSLKYLKGCFAD